MDAREVNLLQHHTDTGAYPVDVVTKRLAEMALFQAAQPEAGGADGPGGRQYNV